jgi:3-dehydroquinate synthase
MKTVHVDLGPRSYDVLIGRGLLDRTGELMRKETRCDLPNSIETKPILVITDPSVKSHYFEKAWNSLSRAGYINLSGYDPEFTPVSEERKSLETAGKILRTLAQHRVSRSGTIVALGGGVVGDLAGFVAATYLRGINFVQVPTTLLAMVDSSVGGKTGVNLPEGKNLVGAFHQPKLVVADLDTLKTLPASEFSAGMAEVIKYGAIKDKALFDRVAKGVKPDDSDLDEIVEKCVAIKARIVEDDEFETKGQRALLNFGHTIGHAIEKATGYNTYLHGEAIALGMRAAAWLSVWQAGLPEAEAREIEASLIANHLPVTLKSEVDRAAILSALGNDKKVAVDGLNRWVLLKKLGEASSGHEVSIDNVKKAIDLLYTPISHQS